MYDEERLEERIAAMPPALCERWQPDGMSAPPNSAMLPQKRAVENCDHPRHFIIEIVGGPRMLVCIQCGKEIKP